MRFRDRTGLSIAAGALCALGGVATPAQAQSAHSILVMTDTISVRLTPCSSGTVHVEAAPGKTIPSIKSFAVIAAPDSSGWTVTQDAASVRLTGKRLRAVVDRHTGLTSFFGADGTLLLRQSAWSFAPAKNPERNGLQPGATFARSSGERFFGGGVIGDNFRQKSTEIALQNDYKQIHIPILYSARGYGFFWDNPSRGKLSVTPDSVGWSASAGDAANFYVMAGPSADAVIGEYRHLTGTAPLFPKWAYGFWFSKNKFDNQKQILDAAATFRERHFPVDLLVQDYFYWKPGDAKDNGTGWGSHAFVPERYPNAKGMIAVLHDRDYLHFMSVIWAKFDPDTEHGKELAAADALYPPHNDWASPRLRYYDPFDPNARRIYGRQVMDSLFSLGVDAFWMDGAEPEMNMDTYSGFDTKAGSGARVIDAFPLLHTTSVYTAQRATTSEKRVVLLPRSAWAGEQRNGACSWTSDIRQDWKTLAWQIEGLQNYSVTGLPYITTDVGGYEPTPESDRELFIRWFQWGAFCPIFRVHGVGRPFPWQYGLEGEAILKKFDLLRYRLLPYIYSQAADVTQKNGTILRPLVMDYRSDPQVMDTWDEFLFGPAFLVCPVHQSAHPTVAATRDQWADKDGHPGGVTASFLKDGSGTPLREDLQDGFSFRNDLNGDQRRADSVRIEGTFTPQESGNLGLVISGIDSPNAPSTVTIERQAVSPVEASGDWQFPIYPLSGKAGMPVHFFIDSRVKRPGIRIVRLPSETPKRDVYLPGTDSWYDFWTGQRLSAGQQSSVEAPLDRIPLYIRAGSIVPMGPERQYATEAPEAPIELRVYRGANGAFPLYEDAGDGYGYEKGAFATIPITWDDRTGTLTLGKRSGSFPGMVARRDFHIVWVRPGHGTGEESAAWDTTVSYEGKEIHCRPSAAAQEKP